MARPQFVMTWAAADTAEALRSRYRSERHGTRRTWLHALWLLREGHVVAEVARVVGAGRRSVDRWVDWYRTGGLAGVLAHHRGGPGRPRMLTPAQEEQVATEVATGRFRTAQEVGAWVNATFAITLRPRTCYAVLARGRCAPKVPRPCHEKADPTMQEAWKRGALSTP